MATLQRDHSMGPAADKPGMHATTSRADGSRCRPACMHWLSSAARSEAHASTYHVMHDDVVQAVHAAWDAEQVRQDVRDDAV